MQTYSIIRFCFDSSAPDHQMTVDTGLTLEEVQAHCSDPETSSRTCSDESIEKRNGGPWFDGYERE